MRFLIATARPAAFAGFLAALQQRGVEVFLASTASSAIDLAKSKSPTLCVVDDSLSDAGPFALVGKLMRANAFLHTAVVSDLSEEAFHDAGEGLGIMMPLPRHPGAAEAETLLQKLAAMA